MNFLVLLLVAQLNVSLSFTPVRLQNTKNAIQRIGRGQGSQIFSGDNDSISSESSSISQPQVNSNDMEEEEYSGWDTWASTNGVAVSPKLSVRNPTPEERGKGGVSAKEAISALEVMACIPRNLIIASRDAPVRAIEAASKATEFSWSTDLTAATVAALHPNEEEIESSTDAVFAKQKWIQSWKSGGWGTNSVDLGPPEADWGVKCVTGSLLATGSDNDHNIYAKFRFPCHPVVHRAGLGLAMLTGCDNKESLEALVCRGRTYRAMRDALLPLVITPSEGRKGSIRERKAWDVADVLSRMLSRATTIELNGKDEEGKVDKAYAVVPLHERLAHCDERGENSKLVATKDEILLVATRDIASGEAITRDYTSAPQLEKDSSEGSLRLLLQFGLPPNAW